jgi:hypothetical protein
MRGSSKKLKKAIARGKVVVFNPTSGEVSVQLFNTTTRETFLVTIGCKEEEELAPKHVSPREVLLSSNLNSCLKGRRLVIR